MGMGGWGWGGNECVTPLLIFDRCGGSGGNGGVGGGNECCHTFVDI